MLTSDQKGAIAEAAIVEAATRLGIGVSKPLISAERYDLIFDLRPGLVRVQCKWGRRQGEVVIVRCYSSRRSRNGIVHRAYAGDEIDAVAAYCSELDRCYLIPRQWIGTRRSLQLRLGPARNNQTSGVSWAPDFELDALDWREQFAGP